jgi:plastocyanin
MCTWTGSGSLMLSAVLVAVVAACGSDGNGGSEPPPPEEDPLVIQQASTNSGDGQTGTVGEVLGSGLRVLITRAAEPEAGVDVLWATADGGSLTPPTSATGADGIATTAWTLGPDPGTQTATATVEGADGSPVTFTATAEEGEPPPPPPPPPPPADATIQVLGPAGGNRFNPTEVTIQAGQTVSWVWPNGSLDHNVEPDGTEPPSSGGLVDGPNDYSYTFTTAGTYDFYCANHGAPGGVEMSGRVIVEP